MKRKDSDPNPSSNLDTLRLATWAEHQRLEDELDLCSPSFTRADYVELLQALRAFLAVWEQAVERIVEPRFPGFARARRKLAWIDADLRHLGFGRNERLEYPEQIGIATFASALGSMYVIEGSTLGGQGLSRHFEKTLGIGPDWGGRYFASYRDRTGTMWQEFGNLANLILPWEIEEMTSSATATFRSLSAWLPQNRFSSKAGAGPDGPSMVRRRVTEKPTLCALASWRETPTSSQQAKTAGSDWR